MTDQARAPGTSDKAVYLFGIDGAQGDASMRDLLGGKGANLAEMASLGLPVPPGLTITTAECAAFFDHDRTLRDDLKRDVESAINTIEAHVGMGFGDAQNPLLLSVRSGARASMPGMMDTILNLGLNDTTVKGLAARSGDARFAYDSYRRFIQMYGDVVLGVDHGIFEDLLENQKNLSGFVLDTELDADAWADIVDQFKQAIRTETGAPFPQDLKVQLWGAISAVFASWRNQRADTYRRLHQIPESWGTAVNVQAMVFGNMGEHSATGVAFTRNPSTGENTLYGEFLINAQGEDVVAGIRTPHNLTESARREAEDDKPSLEATMPEVFADLQAMFAQLEDHYRDMQDIEFTIQEGRLWLLQTRSGKRTLQAALKIAVDMAEEGRISRDEAVCRVDASALDQLLHPTIDPDARKELIAAGLPASPGAATGAIVFTSDAAEQAKRDGKDVILVRTETSPEDIHGMHAAVGILTARGGMTSHAAVVARGMGRPCVSGAGTLKIDASAGRMSVAGATYHVGDVITIDGASGHILKGAVPMRQPALTGDFGTLMGWADAARTLKVRANADTPRDGEQALHFGAEGIGLCRTEHMFFDDERILAMRQMICAADEGGRRKALATILPMQRGDFIALFKLMGERPVTIRLLDPPLHEFLPHEPEEIESVATSLGMTGTGLKARVSELQEFNPMLGFRGCRIAIRYPEIPQMQARAILEAAVEVERTEGIRVTPEIMLPLIAYRAEFDLLRDHVNATAAAIEAETGHTLRYEIGTMVELPRACLRADEIARDNAGGRGAAFFSFGTNDLTQTCLGLSRDDAAPILTSYQNAGVFEQDPFVSLDQEGVGALMTLGIAGGREAQPGMKLGICGEHGGDPASVAYCHAAGLDYVSCSPFRVPVARLAAAQAAIRARAADADADAG
ncbi:MAG: pyruvate, phosphate dikinase [Pseudomonadota bacterium]